VIVTVDGAFGTFATAGHPRPDIAAMYGANGLNSGFDAVLPSAVIDEGDRTIGVVKVIDGATYHVGPRRRIRIVRSALRTTISTPVVEGIHIQVDIIADCKTLAHTQEKNDAPVFAGDESFRVVGWAADLANAQPCAGVYAIVDDVDVVRGRYGLDRLDVATALGRPQLRYSGYEIRLDAGALGAGDHVIRVVALSADGEGRSEPSPPRRVSIRPR